MQIPLVNVILLALLITAVLNEWHDNHFVMVLNLLVFTYLVWWLRNEA